MRRKLTYLVSFLVLFLGGLALQDSTWQGSMQLHTLMEAIATVLALNVGILALVRFYSKKDNTFLFVGTGFLATGLLDGYHAIVTSSYFAESFPSSEPSLIPWSWLASRLFLSILLWLSWLFWKREERLGEAGRVSERRVYAVVSALSLMCFALFVFVPLPPAYFPNFIFPRPQEFIPAVFFLLALAGYLRKGKWKNDSFEHWLVLSIIVNFMSQAMFMSSSGQLYDMMFDSAHLLKKLSYICTLTGLMINMHWQFRLSEQSKAIIAESEEKFRQIATSAQDAVLMMDNDGRIAYWNAAAERIFGYTREEALGKELHSFLGAARYYESFDKSFQQFRFTGKGAAIGKTLELAALRKDGTEFPIELSVSAVRIGDKWSAIGIMRDITDRKRMEEQLHASLAEKELLVQSLHELATHDGLTGLYNHRAFYAQLEDELARSQRSGRPASLLLLDIDHFKQVNDVHGHLAGDAVLRGLSELLVSESRTIDRVCRYGGEEVTVILPETDLETAARAAERLRAAVEAQPFDVNAGAPLHITVSIGIASFSAHADNAQALVAAADAALYAAKQGGRNRVIRYEPALGKPVARG